MSFSNEHLQELKKFLSFFYSKANILQKEIDKEFQEFKKSNFRDEIYNKDEVLSYLTEFNDSLNSVAEKEMHYVIRMIGIYLQMALIEFDRNNIKFHGEFSLVENMEKLEELQALDLKQANSLMDNSGPKKSNLNRLPTILASQNESSLTSKLSQMEEELDALRIKNILLQDELLKATNNNPVSNEPVYFEDLSLKTEEELRCDLRKLENQYKDLASQNSKLLSHTESLKNELNLKLNESKQFKNLKTMIQSKNDDIKELKFKLSKYEKSPEDQE